MIESKGKNKGSGKVERQRQDLPAGFEFGRGGVGSEKRTARSGCPTRAEAKMCRTYGARDFLIRYPGLRAWAKLCRAYGAGLPPREIFLQVVYE